MMNDCDVSVELDTASVAPGEKLTGTATIESGSSLEEYTLLLELEWFTEGRGNSDSAVERMVEIDRGSLAAGESRDVTFAVEPPGGPFSYRGHYVNVRWRARVRADIPWALDPEDEVGFELERGGVRAFNPGNEKEHRYGEGAAPNPTEIRWGIALFGAVFAAFSWLLVSCANFPFPVSLGIGGLFSAIGLGLVYVGVRNYLAQIQLGDVDIEIEPLRVAPGETIDAKVTLQPDAEVELNGVRFEVRGREKVERGHGTDSTTYTHIVHEAEEVAEGTTERSLSAGTRAVFEMESAIPDSAPTTFHATDNEVHWLAKVHVDIPAWPDLVQKEYLLVRPPEAGESSEEQAEDAYEQTW